MSGSGVSVMAKVAIGLALALALGVFGTIVYLINKQSEAAAQPCPLCDAVATEDPAKVRAAIDAGAPVDIRAWRAALERVESPIDRGGAPLDIVQVLAEHGADPNYSWTVSNSGARTSTRTSTTRWASQVIAAEADAPAIIEALLAHGLDVKGRPGGEALCAAAAQAHERIVVRLLQAGVSSNYVADFPRRTALAEAIQTRHAGTIAAIEKEGGREW